MDVPYLPTYPRLTVAGSFESPRLALSSTYLSTYLTIYLPTYLPTYIPTFPLVSKHPSHPSQEGTKESLSERGRWERKKDRLAIDLQRKASRWWWWGGEVKYMLIIIIIVVIKMRGWWWWCCFLTTTNGMRGSGRKKREHHVICCCMCAHACIFIIITAYLPKLY